MGFFNKTKRAYHLIKHKKEIEDCYTKIFTNIEAMYSKHGKIEGGLGNISYYTTKLISLYIFRNPGKQKFNYTVFLTAFWYVIYYLKTLEQQNVLLPEEREKKYISLFKNVVEDIYIYQANLNFKENKSYYLEKMNMIFRYYNSNDHEISSPKYVKEEMLETISNSFFKNRHLSREERFSKISDLRKLLDEVTSELKKAIIKEEG